MVKRFTSSTPWQIFVVFKKITKPRQGGYTPSLLYTATTNTHQALSPHQYQDNAAIHMRTHIAYILVGGVPKYEECHHDGVEGRGAHVVVTVTDLLGDKLEGLGRGRLTHVDAVRLYQAAELFQAFYTKSTQTRSMGVGAFGTSLWVICYNVEDLARKVRQQIPVELRPVNHVCNTGCGVTSSQPCL